MGFSFSTAWKNLTSGDENAASVEPVTPAPIEKEPTTETTTPEEPKKSTWDSIKSGASTAWTWTKDTAAPAVYEVGAYTIAISPVGSIANIGEQLTGKKLPDWAGGGLAERNRIAVHETANFIQFTYDNPGRSGALVAQGASNAVTGITGLAVDGVRLAGNLTRDVLYTPVNYIVRPTVNGLASVAAGAYNLGVEDNAEKWAPKHWDRTAFFDYSGRNLMAASSYLHEAGQIREWSLLSEDAKKLFEMPQAEITDSATGKLIQNPNFAYERAWLYGTQVLIEVPLFAVATGGIGALGGTVLGGTRFAKSANTLRSAVTTEEVLGRTATLAKTTDTSALALNTAGNPAANHIPIITNPPISPVLSPANVIQPKGSLFRAMIDGGKSGFEKGFDFGNPLTDGKWGKGFQAVGVIGGFSASYYFDEQNQKALQAMAQGTLKAPLENDNTVSEGEKALKDILRDLRAAKQPKVETPATPQGSNLPFPSSVEKTQDPNAINAKNISTEFDNRATALCSKLPEGCTLFEDNTPPPPATEKTLGISVSSGQ